MLTEAVIYFPFLAVFFGFTSSELTNSRPITSKESSRVPCHQPQLVGGDAALLDYDWRIRWSNFQVDLQRQF
jgi:hypothetical protein